MSINMADVEELAKIKESGQFPAQVTHLHNK
jgi:hypothetical protein